MDQRRISGFDSFTNIILKALERFLKHTIKHKCNIHVGMTNWAIDGLKIANQKHTIKHT